MPEPANMHRKPNKSLCQKTSQPEAECLASRSTRPCAQTTGMAILDTGASRSVIGIEHVPSVLRKLPPSIREQIREVPSQIGFRFGNNQVEYSFKQLQIPLEHGRQRIWLLVEVVPKATPFLLSIKAMKSLGASIDLENNTCYLKKLNRSLPLRENSNGLFVIDMFDLCRSPDKPSTASAAFVASSHQLIAPPGLDPPLHFKDAIASGSSGGFESVVRRSDGELEGALLHVVHSHESPAAHRGDAGAGHDSDSTADQRGEGSTNEDHRTGRSDPTTMPGPSSEIQWTYVGKPGAHHRFRPMGDGRDGGRVQSTSKCWSGPKYFPTDAIDPSASDEYEDCGDASGSQPSSSSWPTKDIKSTNQSCSPNAFRKQSSCPHKSCFGKLGSKASVLGSQTPGQDFRVDLQQRSGVREVAAGSKGLHDRGCGGFRKLLHHSPAPGISSSELRPDVGSWQPIRDSPVFHAKHEEVVMSHDEAMWLKDVHKLIKKGNNNCPQLDILEVYAYPDSQLTEVATACGLKAKRFTKEDGDLSTPEGRTSLIMHVLLYRPKNLWLSPECAPWSAWNRFNSYRSMQGFRRVWQVQQDSRVHLKLCNLLAKIQASEGRHTHLENPWTSGMWNQRELEEFLRMSFPAKLDQCQFGLKHPESQDPMQKKTRIQTTSRDMLETLDSRLCHGEHVHAQIAGNCQWRNQNIRLSQFASRYPRQFAKAIIKGIMKGKGAPIERPVYHVEDHVEGPPNKKAKLDHESPEAAESANQNEPWKPIFNKLKSDLPKSGIQIWTNPMHPTFKSIQELVPDLRVGAIKAGKGLERYIMPDTGWADDLPIRKTIVLLRSSTDVVDLGHEDWTKLTKLQQHRHAKPSHVMLCIFATQVSDHTMEIDAEGNHMPQSVNQDATVQEVSSSAPAIPASVPTWTPVAASVSGPKFLALTETEQATIRKLHNNLGHPTAEKLARHLSEARAQKALIDGASDYLCASCSERSQPKLSTPGNLKDPKEFNEKVSVDWFEWKGKKGLKYDVFHILDEATRFHLGQRFIKDSPHTVLAMKQLWFLWAGYPQQIAHDQGGEFVTPEWKDLLLQHGIQPILSAAPWQRGRIERHGGIIEEMLSRIDNEMPIENQQQFDEALQQCFHAKNTMSVIDGFSPEQAVLGKASRLPASIASDENTAAHLNSMSDDLPSTLFQQKLRMRTAARAAFAKADSSDALRRAMLRRSRGVAHPWACGQLCMYWDKRKSPNVLEKGRWNGPAQIVCQESRTIIWITHLNRLLRCAHENLRPVSLREFQQHSTFVQTSSQDQLQRMAQQLQYKLRERSGLFQYLDISEIDPPTDNAENNPDNPNNPSEGNSPTNQPEEEPNRRNSNAPQLDDQTMQRDAQQVDQARNVPVPDSPMSSIREEAESEVSPEAAEEPPSTASFDTDQESSHQADDMEPVYNATILENSQDSDIHVEDCHTAWTDQDCHEVACTSFAFELPQQQLTRFLKRPKEFLPCLTVAAKKSRHEVTYSELTAEEKKLFQAAKQKELKCWLDTSTVQAILRDRIHPSRIMSSRWILTWKDDPSSTTGRKAKARLVVKGFQDPDIGTLCSDSPTMTRDSRMLLLQTVSSMQWMIQSFDITTAFLRGRSDERELAMEAPAELKELLGMTSNQVCLLKGNAYGRVDAPLLFYKEFRKRLEQVGFEAHPLDNCLFLLRNSQNPQKLDGILGTHVDDGIGGGNEQFEKALQQLEKSLPFGSREYGSFKFTGLDIEQLPDHSIKVNQGKYIHKICPIDVPKTRRAQPESQITPHEMQQLRGLCGSLQYAAVHSRPDIAARVAGLQRGINQATVETLLEGNRTLREAQTHAETAVIVRSIPISEICFASFGDASFASAKQLSAQQGLFIMACTPKLGNNETTEFSPIVWHSKQIGRVVRSTLSAEAYAMSSSLDKLTWIRCMWGYIKNPYFVWSQPETSLKQEHQGLMITDCKSLYDLITKTAVPNCQEWRTTIEVMLLKEQSRDHTACRWISTAIMLADCLTKTMDATFLRKVMQLGKFRIYDEDMTLRQNANRKFGVTWLHNRILR